MGTALTLTPAIADALVESVRNGIPAGTAAAGAGLDDATVRHWIQIGRERLTHWQNGAPIAPDTIAACQAFYARIHQAESEFEARLVENITQAGYRELKNGAIDWRAHEALLKRHNAYRDNWRESKELQIEHSGQVSHEHRLVRQLPEPELIELVSPDIAGLLD